MYVCAHTYIHIYVYVKRAEAPHIHTYIDTHIHTYIHTYIIQVYVKRGEMPHINQVADIRLKPGQVCMHAFVYLCVCVYLCVAEAWAGMYACFSSSLSLSLCVCVADIRLKPGQVCMHALVHLSLSLSVYVWLTFV